MRLLPEFFVVEPSTMSHRIKSSKGGTAIQQACGNVAAGVGAPYGGHSI
jgi:hypothetical protein